MDAGANLLYFLQNQQQSSIDRVIFGTALFPLRISKPLVYVFHAVPQIQALSKNHVPPYKGERPAAGDTPTFVKKIHFL